MFVIFGLLFLVYFSVFLAGLIKPSFFLRGENPSRFKFFVVGTPIVFALLYLVILTASPASTKETTDTNVTTSPQVQGTEVTEIPPTPTPGSKHGGVFATVVNVIDGDTIKIDTGETVRYIGIDTPETVHPSKPVQCYGKEASVKNQQLVEGKVVELEKDVSEKDQYGRLLRYIWIGDSLINEVLVRDGYAQSSSYPPDIKYQDRFIEAQRLARQEEKGLWSSVCAITPPPKPTIVVIATPKPTTPPPPPNGGGGEGAFVCNCSKTCPQMSSCAEAQYQLNTCGCSRRDADGDGIACDSDCQ